MSTRQHDPLHRFTASRLCAALAAAFICLPVAAKEFRSADVHPED